MKSWYHDKNVLVTGGAGFIGSHIVELLVSYGAHVTVLDNFSTGSMHNLTSCKNDLSLITGDITDIDTCIRATQNQTVIFHTAAFICVSESLEKPNLCNTTNVIGTYNLLESARKNQVERFVFSSSCAVYGAHDNPCDEQKPCYPKSPYAYSKLLGEIYCQQYARIFDLKTICLRYFNVFGPRQSPHGQYAAAMTKFRHAMKNNKPIVVYGDGTQTRDFISVHTVAQANVYLTTFDHMYLDGSPINIAQGKSITINQLIKQLCHEFPEYNQTLITYAPKRIGDVHHSYANCTRYHALKTQTENFS